MSPDPLVPPRPGEVIITKLKGEAVRVLPWRKGAKSKSVTRSTTAPGETVVIVDPSKKVTITEASA